MRLVGKANPMEVVTTEINLGSCWWMSVEHRWRSNAYDDGDGGYHHDDGDAVSVELEHTISSLKEWLAPEKVYVDAITITMIMIMAHHR